MKTRLTIDNDVLSAANELAAAGGQSVGEGLSELARTGLTSPPSVQKTRNGIPLLTLNLAATRVTSALVQRLCEEIAD